MSTTRSAGQPDTVELVVLLDEQGVAIGTAPKASVHTADTPLHRAFSCYAFSTDGHLLLTRRADTKATFPGVWTNTVCGHPAPGESDLDAVTRRAGQELGLRIRRLQPALPAFRYRAAGNGIVENEICPVYLATVDEPPRPDPAEVSQVRWSRWPQFLGDLHLAPDQYSPWCRLQAGQPELHHAVQHYLARLG